MVAGRAAGRLSRPDRRERFDLTGEAAVTQVENGQADWIYDHPPADRLARSATKYREQLFLNSAAARSNMAMNTRCRRSTTSRSARPSTTRSTARAIQQLCGGPSLGHDHAARSCRRTSRPTSRTARTRRTRARSGRAPDMAKAKQLVDASGTAGRRSRSSSQHDEHDQGDRPLLRAC